jgi:hypothetical protein
LDLSAQRIDADELEQALCQISDIQAARIVVTPNALDITEIHVLALPNKSPKQLVRDIESTLMARFGVEVDHKKISIAQIGSDVADAIDADSTARGPRPKIASINTQVSGVHAQATVGLEYDGQLYVGQADGSASQTSRARLVAQACLVAVEQFVPESFGLALEDVSLLKMGREEVAVSCVAVVSPMGEQTVAGSAIVRMNEKDSIVRATLDAINRRLASLTTA